MAIVAEISTSPMGFFIRAPSALGAPSPIVADNIDPVTRDFKSLTVGMGSIESQVQVAVTTQRASGVAVEEDGIQISLSKMTGDLENRLEADARLALRRLVKLGDIRITGITFDFVEDHNQVAQMRVAFINLRAADAKVRVADVPLRVPSRVI